MIDQSISKFLNSFAHQSELFDRSVAFGQDAILFKGLLFLSFYVWFWFSMNPGQERRRIQIICSLSAVFFTMAVCRGLAHILPFRERPVNDPGLNLVLPYGVSPQTFDNWSSFPSDNAGLFFALAFGFVYMNRVVGWMAIAWAACFIGLARIYLGYHYASDILGGAMVALAAMLFSHRFVPRSRIVPTLLHWAEHHPGPFYACAWVIFYQVATMFAEPRAIGSVLRRLLFD